MALPYSPKPGEILVCAFDDCSVGAEMIKTRPVIVVSRPESHGRKLCSVVPLSTTAPHPPLKWHHSLAHLQVVGWQASGPMWAKCDMIATVSFERLNKPYKKTRQGRNYVTHMLDPIDLAAVRECIRAYLTL